MFLDRDGVISVPEFRDGRSFAPIRLADFRLYPEAAVAVARLRSAGFLVIVVTNQPDVGAGLVARETIEAMHAKLQEAAPVDDIEVCFETRAQASERRKPGPGMLLDAAAKWSIDLGASYMVGDRAGDRVAQVVHSRSRLQSRDYVGHVQGQKHLLRLPHVHRRSQTILGDALLPSELL